MKPFEVKIKGQWEGDGEFAFVPEAFRYSKSGENKYAVSASAEVEWHDDESGIVQRKEVAPSVGATALLAIAVTTPPTTIAYTAGDTFSATGAVVTAYYNDGSKKTVTASATWPTSALATTDTYVEASYGGMKAKVGIIVASASEEEA